jgi:Polyketide cyclase / dehydrase and lipid transport
VRRPWFKARPVEEDFFDSAPLLLREEFDIPHPAERVWGELTNDEPLAWCRILQAIDWTSRRPFGVGTTRTVHALGGLAVLRERYFRWEEGRRHSFTLEEATAPLFRGLAEDYLVEPTSDTSCRFTWTIAIEPHPIARIGNPMNKALLGTLFADTRKHYRIR